MIEVLNHTKILIDGNYEETLHDIGELINDVRIFWDAEANEDLTPAQRDRHRAMHLSSRLYTMATFVRDVNFKESQQSS